MAKVHEINFDGLIGPTHNFSGLSLGNQASMAHGFEVSHPKKAALEGLHKMKLLYSLGIKQGFFPPPLRPNLKYLREKGYEGEDVEILEKVNHEDPELLRIVSSASSMWTANAATVTPSIDSLNGNVHLTAANLLTHPHRALEGKETYQTLNRIFANKAFDVYAPLGHPEMLDEGAANHMRLAARHDAPGIHLFVYGLQSKFPVRQSLLASKQIALDHQIDQDCVLFIQQNPEAINAGVFHNDVIATSNERVLFLHEEAFVNTADVVSQLKRLFKEKFHDSLVVMLVSAEQLSLQEAVQSYLFNSQIVTRPGGSMALIAPMEAQEGRPKNVIDELLMGDNLIEEVHYVSLKESMANGGGPACLRLRVTLSDEQLKMVHPGFLLDDATFSFLEAWVDKYYRDELHIHDLSSPQLFAESKEALQSLEEFINNQCNNGVNP